MFRKTSAKLCLGCAENVRLSRHVDADIARIGPEVDGVMNHFMQPDLLFRLTRSCGPSHEQQFVDHTRGLLGQSVEPTKFRTCLWSENTRQIVADTSAQMAYVSQRRAEIVSECGDQYIGHVKCTMPPTWLHGHVWAAGFRASSTSFMILLDQ